jgi:hypothetical protein
MIETPTVKLEVKVGAQIRLKDFGNKNSSTEDTSVYNVVAIDVQGERRFVVSPAGKPFYNFRVSINQISRVL